VEGSGHSVPGRVSPTANVTRGHAAELNLVGWREVTSPVGEGTGGTLATSTCQRSSSRRISASTDQGGLSGSHVEYNSRAAANSSVITASSSSIELRGRGARGARAAAALLLASDELMPPSSAVLVNARLSEIHRWR
jgi:hypothetical protein